MSFRFKNAFTLTEVILVLAIMMSVLLGSVALVAPKKLKKPIQPYKAHGTFECYWAQNDDGELVLMQYSADNGGHVNGPIESPNQEYCEFEPVVADLVTFQVIGAGQNSRRIDGKVFEITNSNSGFTQLKVNSSDYQYYGGRTIEALLRSKMNTADEAWLMDSEIFNIEEYLPNFNYTFYPKINPPGKAACRVVRNVESEECMQYSNAILDGNEPKSCYLVWGKRGGNAVIAHKYEIEASSLGLSDVLPSMNTYTDNSNAVITTLNFGNKGNFVVTAASPTSAYFEDAISSSYSTAPVQGMNASPGIVEVSNGLPDGYHDTTTSLGSFAGGECPQVEDLTLEELFTAAGDSNIFYKDGESIDSNLVYGTVVMDSWGANDIIKYRLLDYSITSYYGNKGSAGTYKQTMDLELEMDSIYRLYPQKNVVDADGNNTEPSKIVIVTGEQQDTYLQADPIGSNRSIVSHTFTPRTDNVERDEIFLYTKNKKETELQAVDVPGEIIYYLDSRVASLAPGQAAEGSYPLIDLTSDLNAKDKYQIKNGYKEDEVEVNYTFDDAEIAEKLDGYNCEDGWVKQKNQVEGRDYHYCWGGNGNPGAVVIVW